MTRATIELKDRTVTLEDSEQTKAELYNKLLSYFVKHRAFSGECICQSDRTQLTAADLLGDIADDIFKFEEEWKGDE